MSKSEQTSGVVPQESAIQQMIANYKADIKCEVCGKTNSGYYQFDKVYGFLIISSHKHTDPIALCPEHRKKRGAKENISNALFGWWGIHAFFWNLFGIVRNFRGGMDVSDQIVVSQIRMIAKTLDAQL